MNGEGTRMRVLGIGALGGFGCGIEALLKAHGAGSGSHPGPVRADTAPLADRMPARALRRIDHFSRLALLGASLALEDMKSRGTEDADKKADKKTGIIIATGYGPAATTFQFLDTLIDDGPALVSPMAFAQSVHNIPAATIGIQLKISGPCSTVSQLRSSVAAGLATASLWLAENRVERVLFGAVEEHTPMLEHCAGLIAHESNAPAPPMLGEGAAFFMLEQGREPGPRGSVVEVGMQARPPLTAASESRRLFLDRPAPAGPGFVRAESHMNLWGDMPIALAFEMALALADDSAGQTVCASLAGERRCSFTVVEGEA